MLNVNKRKFRRTEAAEIYLFRAIAGYWQAAYKWGS